MELIQFLQSSTGRLVAPFKKRTILLVAQVCWLVSIGIWGQPKFPYIYPLELVCTWWDQYFHGTPFPFLPCCLSDTPHILSQSTHLERSFSAYSLSKVTGEHPTVNSIRLRGTCVFTVNIPLSHGLCLPFSNLVQMLLLQSRPPCDLSGSYWVIGTMMILSWSLVVMRYQCPTGSGTCTGMRIMSYFSTSTPKAVHLTPAYPLFNMASTKN